MKLSEIQKQIESIQTLTDFLARNEGLLKEINERTKNKQNQRVGTSFLSGYIPQTTISIIDFRSCIINNINQANYELRKLKNSLPEGINYE